MMKYKIMNILGGMIIFFGICLIAGIIIMLINTGANFICKRFLKKVTVNTASISNDTLHIDSLNWKHLNLYPYYYPYHLKMVVIGKETINCNEKVTIILEDNKGEKQNFYFYGTGNGDE